MSRMATTPGPFATCSPSRYSLQKRHSSGSEDPLLGHRAGPHADELTHGRVHEPRRIVVAVAPARPVHQHGTLVPDLAAPALEARLLRELAEPRAPLALDLLGNRVVARSDGSRARGVRKDVHLRDSRGLDHPDRPRERALVLAGETDDDVARQVEAVGEPDPPQVHGRV